jgi:hypothetical protein
MRCVLLCYALPLQSANERFWLTDLGVLLYPLSLYYFQ